MPEKICDPCDQTQRLTNYVSSLDTSDLYHRLRLEVIDQRCRLHWSQNELAQMANISRSTLGSFERGATISLRNFLTITQTLRMHSAWGSFIYNAQFNPGKRDSSVPIKIIQTRPTRSRSKKSGSDD